MGAHPSLVHGLEQLTFLLLTPTTKKKKKPLAHIFKKFPGPTLQQQSMLTTIKKWML